jgi:outer membrane protein assembly factor BamE (lipoprotein component of BamABCDE complex)
MKFKSLSLLAALLLGALILSGCASSELIRPKQSEIDAYLQANPDLPQTDQSCIADGRFEIGMLAATVRFLLGEPDISEPVKQPWAQQEHWRYKKGKTRLFVIEDKHVVGIDEFDSKGK